MVEGRTDAAGHCLLCGVPADQPVRLEVPGQLAPRGAVELVLGSRRVGRRAIVVR